MQLINSRKLRPTLTLASVLLVVLPAQAQEREGSGSSTTGPAFQQLDTDNDGRLDWQELTQGMRGRLPSSELTEAQVLRDYDQNQDRLLNQNEYHAFRRGITEEQTIRVGEGNGNVVEGRVSVTELDQTQIANLVEKQVFTRDGELLGQSQEVVENQKGERGLVVSAGNRRVVIKLNELRLSDNGLVWQMGGGSGALNRLPDYNEKEYVSAR